MYRYTKTVYNYSFTPPSSISEDEYNSYKQSYTDPLMRPKDDSVLKEIGMGVLKVLLFPFGAMSGGVESNRNWDRAEKEKLEFLADLKGMILSSQDYYEFNIKYKLKYCPVIAQEYYNFAFDHFLEEYGTKKEYVFPGKLPISNLKKSIRAVIVCGDYDGNVVFNDRDNPGNGYIRVAQEKLISDDNGLMIKKNIAAYIIGTISDLEDLNWKKDQELDGKIVIKEQLTPVYKLKPEINYKVAGKKRIVCTIEGSPIYRKTSYTTNVNDEDVFIQHDNQNEINNS